MKKSDAFAICAILGTRDTSISFGFQFCDFSVKIIDLKSKVVQSFSPL
jgi:hypothetical protein